MIWEQKGPKWPEHYQLLIDDLGYPCPQRCDVEPSDAGYINKKIDAINAMS